jgi:hypothetical protein
VTRGRPTLGAAVVLGCALHFAACASRPPPPSQAPPYSGPLVDPATVSRDFLDRQQITATYAGRTTRFDAVVQKRGGALTVLGLTPFGSRAFVLQQTGNDVSFQSFVPQTMPFPPRYILIDVQRVYFASLAALSGGPPPDGEQSGERDGEIETERWQGGALLSRTFRRADGSPAGEIAIDYGRAGMGADGTPPRQISLSNGWYGYRLDIAIVSHERL